MLLLLLFFYPNKTGATKDRVKPGRVNNRKILYFLTDPPLHFLCTNENQIFFAECRFNKLYEEFVKEKLIKAMTVPSSGSLALFSVLCKKSASVDAFSFFGGGRGVVFVVSLYSNCVFEFNTESQNLSSNTSLFFFSMKLFFFF